jgi:hypothetical protein
MTNIKNIRLPKIVGFVPAATVPETSRIISGYICKSSIFSYFEKTLGYSLAVFRFHI